MNETSIAFVLIGLKRTENLLLANEQLRRRFSATVAYDRFTFSANTSLHFVMLLQAIEGELPVQTISFVEPAMIKRFYRFLWIDRLPHQDCGQGCLAGSSPGPCRD